VKHVHALMAAAVGALIAGAVVVVAGPLNPPAGPVSSTYKTLTQVEPRVPVQSLAGDSTAIYVINQAGSYYLTGNISGVPNKHGIAVRASNVSIDLCGFTMDGGHYLGVAIDGHDIAPGQYSTLSVRNGVIYDWNQDGIFADRINDCLFDGVQVRGTPDVAIAAGAGSLVRNCEVSSSPRGIMVGTGSRVIDCVVRQPTQYGYILADGASASRCSSHSDSTAVIAFSAGNNAALVECTVVGGSVGIDLTGGANRVDRCKVGQATTGIRAAFANTIVDNTLNAASFGVGQGIVLTQSDNRVERNHVYVFATGIQVPGNYSVVLSNAMHNVLNPVVVTGSPNALVAPIVTSAAALASNPVANTSQ
jgi:hypothetical protein